MVPTQRKGRAMAKCQDCNRVFDLTDETEAEEFYYGHDCEEWSAAVDRVLEAAYHAMSELEGEGHSW